MAQRLSVWQSAMSLCDCAGTGDRENASPRTSCSPERWRGSKQIVAEYQVECIVLGYPKNMNNTEGERCEKTKEFQEMLERRTGLEVICGMRD